MDTILRRIIDNNFSDLKGAVVNATIPVPQALINELIQTALEGNRNIESIQVSVHEGNRAVANIKTRMLPLALNLKLKLDRSIDFASYSSPKMRAWLENNRLLGSLGGLLNVLPEGIKFYGNQVVVDLGYFLRTPEQQKHLALVKSVGIATEEGRLILDVHIKVE
jgi:hypothetical protein